MIENFHPEHHHSHHSMGDPFVQETSKTSEIRDNFGKVRFKVYLIDMLDYYDEKEDCDDRFVVSVYSLCYSLDPYKILEETFNEPSDAYCFYNKCIENYKHIVQVETKDFQDIAIYAEKINYHKIDPDCCLNCRFCHNDHTGIHLECHNRNNFVFEPGCPHDHNHNYYHTDEFLRIFPKVHNNGICDNYKRRNKTDRRLNPDFSHELDWIIDRHVEERVDQELEYIQNGIIDANSGDADEIN